MLYSRNYEYGRVLRQVADLTAMDLLPIPIGITAGPILGTRIQVMPDDWGAWAKALGVEPDDVTWSVGDGPYRYSAVDVELGGVSARLTMCVKRSAVEAVSS